MVSEPGSAIPQQDLLADALRSLRTQLTSLTSEPDGARSRAFLSPSADQQNITPLRPYCVPNGMFADIVLALLDGSIETLELHALRPTPFLGAPPRCAHDHQTWPCRTRVLLRKALAGVVDRDACAGEAS